MKRLLVLEGSPRRQGHSAALADALCGGLKDWQIQRVAVSARKIGGCLACDRCWSRDGQPCVQRDDMNALSLEIEAADVVAFATPMYYFGFPTQLKAVIDRLYPYCKDNRPRSISGKGCLLLACGATDDREEFQPLLENYRILARYLEWEDLGVLAAHGVYERGAIQGTHWLREAGALAEVLNAEQR